MQPLAVWPMLSPPKLRVSSLAGVVPVSTEAIHAISSAGWGCGREDCQRRARFVVTHYKADQA